MAINERVPFVSKLFRATMLSGVMFEIWAPDIIEAKRLVREHAGEHVVSIYVVQ